jgi:ABC-type sugar transport system ATPase subunit
MIELRDVHKRLGEFAVRGVSLTIAEGEYFVVLGPTGAGKTVLLECIAGLHPLDRGRIFLRGVEVTHLAPEKRRLAYVPQDYVVFPHLSVYDNIAFSLRLQRWPAAQIRQRVQELAEWLGIEKLLGRRPATLSGGEQQRTALARALAPRPTALLLDEPLSALDENTRLQIAEELKSLPTKFGTTVIHVCHNFEEAMQLATRLAVLYQGQVVQTGPPEEVFCRPNCRFMAEFMRVQNVLAVEEVAEAEQGMVEVRAGGLRLLVAAQDHPPPPLALSVRPEHILIARQAGGGPNSFWAKVSALRPLTNSVQITLAAGQASLQALLTRQVCEELQLAVGAEVAVTIPPRALHLLPDRFLPDSLGGHQGPS